MSDTTTPTTPTTAPVKPGYQTTEFWLSLAAILVGAVVSSGIVPETGPYAQVVGLITSVLGGLGYTVSRTMIKKG